MVWKLFTNFRAIGRQWPPSWFHFSHWPNDWLSFHVTQSRNKLVPKPIPIPNLYFMTAWHENVTELMTEVFAPGIYRSHWVRYPIALRGNYKRELIYLVSRWIDYSAFEGSETCWLGCRKCVFKVNARAKEARLVAMPAQQFGPAMQILNGPLLFISLEIDCFHGVWTRKYLHSMTKLSGWLCHLARSWRTWIRW